ncbi:SCO7613 C-terminal domain-containing membrane protein [Micromonospora sp. CP22]|uniref:SCO7613 C-terminal domain-containing membrane protein n=1 Tax=Micromonospora sp. CP22 TaxID=2580517 RepID=UPI0013297FAA|nr:hypothetical protein [Micromonospora sp. CP22]MTK01037.1 hypothetical protein [Micromonospora sp. CP22]
MDNAYPCPACGSPANLNSGCSGCGRPPHPAAAEVIRLDREIVVLGGEVQRARQAYEGLRGRLEAVRRRRGELAAAIRTEFPVPAVPPVGGGAPAVGGYARPVPVAASAGRPVEVPVRPGGAEASTRTVQGLLFVLGGLLLGTAAMVFAAVAWASVGVAGRALILLAFTALLLAVPLVARWRGLRGTAETFAAVGLLLVLLDGYAAWSVDLFAVTTWPGSRYAALVAVVGAAVAVGYARLSRLVVPWFAALLVAQPVLPLFAAEARPEPAGWAVVFVGVAVVDLAVVVALRQRAGVVAGEGAATTPALRLAGTALAWIGFAGWLLLAAGCALVPLLVGRAGGVPLLAGGPMLLVALTAFGAALLTGGDPARTLAGGALVPVLAGAVVRPVVQVRPSVWLLVSALVVVGLAAAVRLLPSGWRTGPRVGALLVAGGAGALAALTGLLLAGTAVGRSLPPWRGAEAGPAFAWGWQLPLVVALSSVAAALLLSRVARPAVLLVGAAATVFAVPVAWAAPWPAVVAIDLVVGAVLLVAAVARPALPTPLVLISAAAGAALLGHGLLVGLAEPAGAGVACAVIAAVGVGVAALGRHGNLPRRVVAGCGLAATVLVVPAGAAITMIGLGAPPWWQARAALAAVALPAVVLLALPRSWSDLTGYASTGLAVVAVLTGLSPLVVPGDERVTVYAAVAASLVALAGFRAGRARPLSVAGLGLAGVAVLAALPMVVTALLTPYGPPPAVWSGVPTVQPSPGALPVGLALLLLSLAALIAGLAPGDTPTGMRGVWWRAAGLMLPFVAAAGLVLLVAAEVPWPVVPAVALLGGVAVLATAALRAPGRAFVGTAIPVGLVLAGGGLLNVQATRAGTLAAAGLLVVAATIVGVGARHVTARLLGWLVAVAAATGFAVTAPLAAGQPLRVAAFAVLGVAALTLALAATLPSGRPNPPAAEAATRPAPESLLNRVLDAVAQAVALLALLLTLGALRHAATVCVLWGVAMGVRLLRRGESTGRRWLFAGIGGGSELLAVWLLLAAGGVTVLEAYTVPVAAVALVAGAVGLRTRAGLNSWLALGPGLAAALLPSLNSVLFGPDPQPWRRLLLGVAALAVTLLGAVRRWQAPVVLGGGTLGLLALHELVRSWDLLPRWAFLAAAGLALIGLATTYERRRRDLLRLRSAVGRMS